MAYSGATVERWTCDQEVAGSIPGRALLRNDSGQVVHTGVPRSPSSIIWYRCNGCVVMEEMWSTVHNAGRKPTAGSRPVKRRWSTASWRRMVCVCSCADHWSIYLFFLHCFLWTGGLTVKPGPAHTRRLLCA